MDMSATSRVVPLGDVFSSQVAAKTDSEVQPEQRVAEVKSSAPSDLQARQHAPKDSRAQHKENTDSGYSSEDGRMIYKVIREIDKKVLLEIPFNLAKQESERAYAEQQRQAEARREQVSQDIVA